MVTKINNLEEKLGKYKNRMELIRTLIGFILLCLQLCIFYHLMTE
jgi:hypothetical protein